MFANRTHLCVPGRGCHRRELRYKTGRQVKRGPVMKGFENYFKMVGLSPTDDGKHERFLSKGAIKAGS